MNVTMIKCDFGTCGKLFYKGFHTMTRLSCGHDLCGRHPEIKNERGEIQCPRGCGSVYIKEILS